MSCSTVNITAIIYNKRGHILSIGKNSYIKTHPLQAKIAKKVGKDECIYLHAEVAAIIKCAHLEKAHRILITRYSCDGKLVNAKPCKICEHVIRNFTGIKIIQYSNNDSITEEKIS